MKKVLISILIFCGIWNTSNAQNSHVYVPDFIKFKVDSQLQKKIYQSLDTLFRDISQGIEKSKLIDTANHSQSIDFFNYIKGLEASKRFKNLDFFKKQLINAYEISANTYLLNIAFVGNSTDQPIINHICSIIANYENGKIKFASPLQYKTKNWKQKQIGNVLYHYKTDLNTVEAEKFDATSKSIAKNLGLDPLQLIFYKCENFQEVFSIIGFEYDLNYNGVLKDSWMLGNTIFQGHNNEQFSHDIFHAYTSKIIKRKDRNVAAEEGIAYSWGDAYYPKKTGEIITRNELLEILKDNLKKYPQINLLDLFEKGSDMYKSLSPDVSVKSVISSVICDEIQQQKGNAGILTLIKCGKGDENFFKTTEILIQLNKSNFNKTVKELIDKTK